MAFVPAKRAVAIYPISIHVYNEAGKKEEIRFTAQYKRQTKTQLDDLQDGSTNLRRATMGVDPIKRPDGSIPLAEELSDIEFLQKYMCGWRGVNYQDATVMEFTPETLGDMLEGYPELVQALINGFWRSHQQISEKN